MVEHTIGVVGRPSATLHPSPYLLLSQSNGHPGKRKVDFIIVSKKLKGHGGLLTHTLEETRAVCHVKETKT